jgi:PAS domain S-box-containing protein
MNERPANILIVEDESTFAGVLGEIIASEGGGRFSVSRAGSLAEATDKTRATCFDVALLDLTLPDARGVETYHAVQRVAPDVAVIVLSGLSDETVALETVRAGAQDYLMKDQFDGRLLCRAIRYAVERKAIERKLREREEFFRLISENVTDLIAVVGADGKRIYNSPSYSTVLGRDEQLTGTNAFEEIHPEDRDSVKNVFSEVITSGQGRRAGYRFIRKDGSVRHVESQSNVIRNESGATEKVVVVSRDVTERIQAESELRRALTELRQSHEQLKTTQSKLVQSEKLEAISTFAAGVAHEVKNPLQTVVLGIDYLRDYVVTEDESTRDLLNQMSDAVRRADAIIRGLVEFSSHRKGAVTEQNLSELFRQSLQAVEPEISVQSIALTAELAENLPAVRLDKRSMKHVLINLLATEIRESSFGAEMSVRTFARAAIAAEKQRLALGQGDADAKRIVVAEVQLHGGTLIETKETARAGDEFGLLVSRKIIELYGGKLERHHQTGGSKLTISFPT